MCLLPIIALISQLSFGTPVVQQPVLNRAETLRSLQHGSPYFDDAYKYADIILSKTRKFAGVKMRLDLETQEVHFISFRDEEAVLQATVVKEISYADTTADGIIFYKFRTGYPSIDGKAAEQFYMVLADGNCSLLRLVEKKVTLRKNEISGNSIKEYETYDHFYLQVKGEMKRLKKDKDFILGELADKRAQVEQFAQTNKINFRNTDQLAKLINYYNTL